MSYKQVRDVLKRAKAFHRRLCEYYDNLSDDSRDERLQLLLEYMSRHEKNMSACLAKYEPTASEGILNTWLQFVPDEQLERALSENELRPDMPVGEIVQRALAVDEAITALYDELASTTAAPRVQEMFASLAELERKKKEQFGWTLLDFEGE